MKHKLFLLLLIVAALLLQACGSANEALIATRVAQTQQIAELQTAAAGGGQAQVSETPLAEDQASAEATATPSLTPTSSIPYVSVDQNTNCRTGPSADYGFVTLINTDEQNEVLKVYNGANYVVIRNPDGPGDCWLWLQYATPANFADYNLPVATQPPTPTPTLTPTSVYVWEGNWKVSPEGATSTCDMSLNVSGNNVTGTYTCPLYSGTVTGTLSADYRTLTGTWDTGGSSGPFVWERKTGNTNQFVGNYNATFYWCGARSGASQPSPCFGP